MDQHFILIITESRILHSDPEYWEPEEYRCDITEYRISTRKLGSWLEQHKFEYGYVKSIVEAALEGKPLLYGYASRKYSFGDTPDWWNGLRPDEDCIDPEKHFSYEVICS
jgi:hypothetical protein